MNFENVEHFGIVVGIVVALYGLWKGASAWRKAHRASIIVQAKQQETMDKIAMEFTPRNGRTLATTVADIEQRVKVNGCKADAWFADNDEAHKEIHRRIDGLFELLGSSSTPRRTADRHKGDHHRGE